MMSNRKRFRSTIKRIKEIQDIVVREYEPGDQKKCYKAVWRRFVFPRYGVCYDTFLSYIGVKPSELEEENAGSGDPNQLSLF